jgi:hypothetical protein
MSPLLAALRAAADEVPSYDVLDAAITLGRRRRRRTALASTTAGAVVLALLALALLPLIGQRGSVSTGEPPAGPALPDRIGSPGVFPAGVRQSPPGPVSLMFTERSGPITPGDRLVVVGASEDTYRGLDATYRAEPGLTALLSPDGGRVAHPSAAGVVVADLHTGLQRAIPRPVACSDEFRPAAWLPDGTGMVVVSTTYAKDPTREGMVNELGTLDLTTGAYQSFAAGTWPMTPGGFAVAVSPDGARIAYQFADFITVYSRATGAKSSFTLPDQRTALAGKGAWTPDGRSLTVVHRDTDNYQARRWQLLLLDPLTGAERDPTYRPSLAQMSVIRLVGWDSLTGRPVVVGFDGVATPDGFTYGSPVLDLNQIRRIGFYELGVGQGQLADAGGFRTLLVAEGITNLDVADSVVASGLTRPGYPPRALSPTGFGAIVVAGLVLLVSLVTLTVRWRWRHLALRAAAADRPI